MKYKLGEFVRFVEERREGYITRIIDDQTIAVTDEDGFYLCTVRGSWVELI